MDLQLRGLRALVTGGSRGIGRECVRSLASEGVLVAFCARDEAALRAVLDEIGGASSGHACFPVDIDKESGPRDLVASMRDAFGLPDILVHNVGGTLGISDPFAPLEDWRRVWRLNFEVALELNAHLIPHMIERRFGRVVAISSLGAVEHRASLQYSIAKNALTSYTRIMGRTVAQHGICMSAIVPGAVMHEGSPWAIKREQDPRFVENYMRDLMPTGRFMTPQEVASFVTFLSSPLASAAVGSVFPIDAGQARTFSI